ncbi:hypothetical protein AVEN_173177-1 [Araneus ventricosus]|uniref:Uncharacterized protein n=1 Tax=Araneus ventricosus TaxID=182803 RepID=A0A4Y2LFT5_ARAVE|nr:hypothetical protein AVEN_173177-1 [Araneus ventricosus]
MDMGRPAERHTELVLMTGRATAPPNKEPVREGGPTTCRLQPPLRLHPRHRNDPALAQAVHKIGVNTTFNITRPSLELMWLLSGLEEMFVSGFYSIAKN